MERGMQNMKNDFEKQQKQEEEEKFEIKKNLMILEKEFELKDRELDTLRSVLENKEQEV